MPTHAISTTGDLTPNERRRQVATILARGVVRHRRIAKLAKSGEFSLSRDMGLELVSKTRLSVSEGLANAVQALECEMNDGRDT